MEKCYTLKGQSLENGLSCIFQAIGNILNSNVKVKETSNMESDLFFPITNLSLPSCSQGGDLGHWNSLGRLCF